MFNLPRRPFFSAKKSDKAKSAAIAHKQSFIQFAADDLAYFKENVAGIAKNIDNETLNKLPPGKFEGEIVLIDQKKQVNDCIERIRQDQILGIDSETRPNFIKGERHQVALFQISTASTAFLFRLNKIGFPHGLTDLLEDPEIIKIGLALENDLPELRRFGPINPASLVDLNKLCPQLGFEMIGARKLTALFFGYRVSKAQQTSNWEIENLTDAQMVYAATDAWICREIYLKICGITPA